MRDDEVQNPAFLRGEDDDLDVFTEEVPLLSYFSSTFSCTFSSYVLQGTNFSNPMYDSVYNDTVTTGEEHGLLARAKLEIAPEELD